MRKLILLFLLLMPVCLQAQYKYFGGDRVHIGENTVVKFGYDDFVSLGIQYKELDGYWGDYDKEVFDIAPPFGFGIRTEPAIPKTLGRSHKNLDKRYKVNHIQSEDKHFLLYLHFEQLKPEDDCLKSIRNSVAYVSKPYAEECFNADTAAMYSLDMEGKKINGRYVHHKAIVAYNRDGRRMILNCFLTDEGLKNFDEKYLKDVEDMWHFEDKE